MKIIDLIFILVCIILVFTLIVYIIYVEYVKANVEERCLQNENRNCICKSFELINEDETENNT